MRMADSNNTCLSIYLSVLSQWKCFCNFVMFSSLNPSHAVSLSLEHKKLFWVRWPNFIRFYIETLKKKCNFFKHLYIFKFYMYNFLPHEFIHFLKCKKPNVLNQNRTLYELYKLQSPNLRTFLNFEVFGHLSFVN